MGADIEDSAVKILEIVGYEDDDSEICEAVRLFHVGYWPHPFEGDYRAAKTTKEKAEIAAARIDFFIATNGTDEQ
jgi:hypothetical protein